MAATVGLVGTRQARHKGQKETSVRMPFQDRMVMLVGVRRSGRQGSIVDMKVFQIGGRFDNGTNRRKGTALAGFEQDACGKKRMLLLLLLMWMRWIQSQRQRQPQHMIQGLDKGGRYFRHDFTQSFHGLGCFHTTDIGQARGQRQGMRPADGGRGQGRSFGCGRCVIQDKGIGAGNVLQKEFSH